MDILPYVVSDGAANTGGTDLVLTTGVAQDSTDGWPALPGDLLMAFGGTGGAQPTGITTSRGDTFTKAIGSSTTPALSAWSVVAGTNGLDATGPGFTADTIDVAYSGTGQAKQWVVIGCQGLGAIDTAAQAQATGTSTAPSVTSGTPTASGDVVFAAVAYQNAGVSFTWGANWIPLATDVTVGVNSLVSVAYRVNTGSGTLTASGTLGASTGWSAIILPVKKSLTLWNGVNPSNGRAIVGASVWKGAYPGELSPNTDQQAKNRFDSIVGRKTANQGCKRYLGEGLYESQANQYQGVVSETLAGIQCLVSVKATRAVGGGKAADIPLIRAMIIYWKNNGVAPHTCLWNEANLNGVNGPFGNEAGSPYAPGATSTSCVTNYQQYFAFYAPTFIKAGLQCFFNSALPSPTTAISFIPPRKQADGRMLCTGVSVDFYMTDCSINYPAGQPYTKTLADTITNCNAQSPKQNVGIGETGGTNGTPRPLTTNPSNFANWLHDMVVVPLAALMPTNQLLPIYWYANGVGNTIDTTTDAQVVTAYDAMYDALDPSGAGGGTLTASSTPLPNGAIGQAYSASLSASGGTLPYTWSIQTGSLTGSGLSLASSGAISGTVAGSPTTYNITWKVTDAVSNTATVTLPITTASVFAFAGATLPAANVGAAYSQSLAGFVSGGATPISYALDTTTQLPTGLSLATSVPAPYTFGQALVTGSGTSRVLPVTTATGPGDTLIAHVVVNSTTCTVTACTDSKGNVYTLDVSSAGSVPALYVFRSPGATGGAGSTPTAALTTSDTLTFTTAAVAGNCEFYGIDVPGVGVLDLISSVATATSTAPSVSITPTANGDTILALFGTANGGGAPTFGSTGFTSLGTYQTGVNPYSVAAYEQPATGGGTAQTSSLTITSAIWRAVAYAFLPLIPAGTLSGTPDRSAAGPPGSAPTAYSFNVIATDHNGATATATFNMNVQSPAPTYFPPPVISPPVTAELYDGNLNPLMPITFTTLNAQLFYNMVGNWQVVMPYDDSVWQQVRSGTTIMVVNWRGLFEFGGKIETPGYSDAVPAAGTGATTGPGEQLTLAGADYLAVIANRIAFPTPGSSWTSQTSGGKTTYTGHCETCIKNLISDNGGPTGQSGRRINIMDIATDQARGTTVTRDIAFVQGADLNLMDIIRSMIGTGGPLGVSLERNGSRLTFDCFVPNDFSQSISFSTSLGNLTSVALALTDPTCTIAFAQSSVSGSNFTSYSVASDQWSRTEQFVDQSGQTQIGNVNQAGNDALNQGAAQPSLVTAFTDIPNMTFGKDYWLGDKVTVEIRPGDVYQDIVSSVSLNVDPAQTPAVSVVPQIGYSSDPGALDPGFASQLLNRVRRLERRLNAQRG